MKISDLQAGRIFLIELETKNKDTNALKKKAEVFLYQPQATRETLLQFSDQVWEVSASDSKHQQTLEEILERNLPRLCWLVSVKQNSLQVQIHEFPYALTLPDELPIGVDEKIIDDVRDRYLQNTASSEDIINWFTQEILMDHPQEGKPPRTLLQAGQSYQNGLENSFQLLGKTIKVNVRRTIEQTLRIERIERGTQRKTQNNIRPFILVNAEFSFCDASIAGTMRGSSRTELDALIENSESYLALWQQYNNLEQEAIVEQAKQLGWLNYHNYKILPNGDRRFFLQSSPQLREQLKRLSDTSNFSLEVDSIPPDFTNISEKKSQPNKFRGQVAQVNFNQRETIDLRPLDPDEETSLPSKGYIFFSLSGDYARLNRRQQAEERIRNAEGGMPQLGLILEQQSVTVRRTRNYKPITKEVKKVFNGMSPTPRQEEAIKVALNTPDIALIQGPPGTGKTKVITAIEARLAEVAEETNRSITHRLLLTSFQHDAVENAAEKTVVYGLPAVRVGGRSRQQSSLDNIDRWRRERIEKLEAQLANTPETAGRRLLKQVGNLVISYARTPRTPQESIPLLKEVLDLTQGRIRKELSDQLLDYIQQLKRPPEIEDDEAREKARKAVRSLRIDAGSFSDDGAIAAQKVLSRLDSLNILTSEQLELLQQAAAWIEETPPPFLEALTNLKEELLEQLTPIEITPVSPISNPEIESLLNQVNHSLRDHIRQSKEGIEDVLEEYLDDLKTDPNGVRETLNNYTVVLAATCQQSAGKAVRDITNTDNSVFETVIVDEAARANPLDLFIPLSKAERRIVLVGDHRQLPHILEPDIEKELRDSSETTQEILQKSLFERLFNHLKNLEKQDGIKRTVTLDTQYRMHPVLGNFVSQNFYEIHGEPHIESQRPEQDFYHHLPDYNTAVASWINVPSRDGKEKQGKSKSRPIEAKIIAEEVARLIKINPELTFGIITFYSAQVTEIWQALETVDLAQISDEGKYEIAPQWRETRDKEGKIVEQLRVGTVDAFQGKEFDIVFLSLVRSNTIPVKKEADLRRKYGFLMLENRLCVAMSRQKRLLIAVGDLAMIQDENASKAIPHLVEFYKLCCSQWGTTSPLTKGG
ncbi:UNVERIFIED_CONTAM: DNA/RNA helicase, partial [Euhalothece sp. KZN 001]